jgi:hypothetical protein
VCCGAPCRRPHALVPLPTVLLVRPTTLWYVRIARFMDDACCSGESYDLRCHGHPLFSRPHRGSFSRETAPHPTLVVVRSMHLVGIVDCLCACGVRAQCPSYSCSSNKGTSTQGSSTCLDTARGYCYRWTAYKDVTEGSVALYQVRTPCLRFPSSG